MKFENVQLEELARYKVNTLETLEPGWKTPGRPRWKRNRAQLYWGDGRQFSEREKEREVKSQLSSGGELDALRMRVMGVIVELLMHVLRAPCWKPISKRKRWDRLRVHWVTEKAHASVIDEDRVQTKHGFSLYKGWTGAVGSVVPFLKHTL